MARPTIRDVAQRAGVSIATVSRALNEKGDIRPETRERVHVAARELGYAADPSARALVTHRTHVVGVVVGDNAGHRDLSLIFFGKVLAAIARRLGGAHYEALLMQAEDLPSRPLDAAIVIGMDGDEPLVVECAKRVPLVGVDVRIDGKETAFVGSDHAEGVRLALAHLHALGHRRVAHIAGAVNTVAGRVRLETFAREAERLGLDVPEQYLRRGDFSSASGYREACAALALDEPPTAIVAASDHMALAVLQAVWDSGATPGRDVAVIGFDDLEAAALAHPPLTTIRQDRQELGTLAAQRALELIERPAAMKRETVVPVELVVRASTTTAGPDPQGSDAKQRAWPRFTRRG
ncbi:MAG TPA: LacI family DNA-binding transcriptional regulator [Gaiellaceae bacterium]